MVAWIQVSFNKGELKRRAFTINLDPLVAAWTRYVFAHSAGCCMSTHCLLPVSVASMWLKEMNKL